MEASTTGYIYKICSYDENIKPHFIGSTNDFWRAKSLFRSLCFHTNDERRKKNSYLYEFIDDNGGWYNWRISILETFEFEDDDDLKNRELELIKETNAILNTDLGCSYLEHKARKEAEQKRKDEEQKRKDDERKEARKEARKELLLKVFRCDCGGKYKHQSKSKHLKSKRHKAYLESQHV